MNPALAVTKLHLNLRRMTFVVPLSITALVALISVLISFLFWRGGSIPGSTEWIAGSRANPGLVYAFSGFMGWFGVSTVSTRFPFALSLGSTRKGFTFGTLLWQVVISLYVTAVFAVLMLIEVATGHWFSNFYIFDNYFLGAGNLGQLVLNVFLGMMVVLSVGGVFAASWVRFATRGPQLLSGGLAVVLLVALLVILPSVSSILAAFQLWWLGVAALVTIAISSLGTWAFLRTATVR